MSLSAKEIGNNHFRKNNYSQAIKSYLEYVQEEHSDNSKAYSNLSLCYLKQKQYNKCIQACQNAIQYDSEMPKPYYRMLNAYRDIGGHQYQVFINGVMFCRKEDKNSKEYEEIKSVVEEYRKKIAFMGGKKKVQIEDYQRYVMFGEEKIVEETRGVEQWVQRWKEMKDSQRESQSLEQISGICEKEYQYGINLAYHYLNQLEDEKQIVKFKQFIKILKGKYQPAILVQQMQEQKPQEKQFVQQSVKQSQGQQKKLQLNNDQKQKIKKPSIQVDPPNLQTESRQGNVQTAIDKENKKQKQSKMEEQKPTLNKIDQQSQISPEEVQSLYKQYFPLIDDVPDKFEVLFEQLKKFILSQTLNKSQKSSTIKHFKDSHKQFNLFKFSLQKSQKYILKEILQTNNLEFLIELFMKPK